MRHVRSEPRANRDAALTESWREFERLAERATGTSGVWSPARCSGPTESAATPRLTPESPGGSRLRPVAQAWKQNRPAWRAGQKLPD